MKKLNTAMLGDIQDDATNATLTLPTGEVISIPSDKLGDLFTGDDENEGDDDDMQGDLTPLLGDRYVESLGTPEQGDLFTGDRRARQNLFGAFLPSVPARVTVRGKKPTPSQKTAVSVLKTIPGAVISTKVMSPCMVNNGLVNNAPTRATIPGAAFVETIRRFETQYPGSTRTQTFAPATNPQAVGFGAGAPGEVAFTPVIFIQVAVARQFTIPSAELIITLTGLNEAGTAIDNRPWSFLLNKALDSTFIAMIPFVEISSTIYPSIARAQAGLNQLNITVAGCPANTTLRVFLPGMDSSQYQTFKEGLGISAPTQRLSAYTEQR